MKAEIFVINSKTAIRVYLVAKINFIFKRMPMLIIKFKRFGHTKYMYVHSLTPYENLACIINLITAARINPKL